MTRPFLAPGFRFHPTDEELVAYYLKRKLLSRPIPVDAIPEVDLYRLEPWDLPGRSPVCGRDLQCFFFCRPDKKHVGSTRTNRATGRGYWKMTGKDREVRNGGRVVGMKKTLVFHAGRAPKGERTNWVMHEYRMVEGVIKVEGVDQDAFVVCRIFQKSIPDPQNGVKYGAPLVEEEWEEDEKEALCADDGSPADPVSEQVGQFDEHEKSMIPNENAVCLVESGGTVGRSASHADLLGDARIEPALDAALSQNIQNDHYLELDDFAAPHDNSNAFLGNGDTDQTSSFLELHGADEFFDAKEEVLLPDVWNTGEQMDDGNMYFDAPTHIPPDFIDSLVATQSAPDPMEELMAYFDAAEGSMEFPSRVKHLDERHIINKAYDGDGAPSSSGTPCGEVGAGGPYEEGLDNSLEGCLAGMLGSISCQPALAAEMSTSIRVTAGMIHIDSYIVHSSWSTRKALSIGGVLLPRETCHIYCYLPSSENTRPSWLTCCLTLLCLALMGACALTK